MGIYSTILSLLLGVIIIFNEVVRKKRTKPFDILTGVNLLFFLSFVVPPFAIYFFNLEFWSWTSLVNIEDEAAVIALFYALCGYLTILIGIHFSKKWTFVNKLPTNFITNKSSVEIFAHVLGILGIFFLLIFIISVGGFGMFLSTNTLYRSGASDGTPLAFIRNLALFIPISCQIFYCLFKFQKKSYFNRYHLFFIFYFVASILLYFNRATRMGLLIFLISFIIINVIYYRKGIIKYIPIIGLIFTFFVIYGKRIYNFFVVEDISFEAEGVGINTIIQEFSFPFYSLVNAVENSFFNDIPRLFVDFGIGFLNLLPSAILPFEVPKSVTQLNIPGVPIDIISLGFYSFGISGVIIIAFLFGILIGFFEKILSDKSNFMVIIFYVQFLTSISLIVPYAGPTNVLKSNFCLLIAFILYIFLFNKSDRTTNNVKLQTR